MQEFSTLFCLYLSWNLHCCITDLNQSIYFPPHCLTCFCPRKQMWLLLSIFARCRYKTTETLIIFVPVLLGKVGKLFIYFKCSPLCLTFTRFVLLLSSVFLFLREIQQCEFTHRNLNVFAVHRFSVTSLQIFVFTSWNLMYICPSKKKKKHSKVIMALI